MRGDDYTLWASGIKSAIKFMSSARKCPTRCARRMLTPRDPRPTSLPPDHAYRPTDALALACVCALSRVRSQRLAHPQAPEGDQEGQEEEEGGREGQEGQKGPAAAPSLGPPKQLHGGKRQRRRRRARANLCVLVERPAAVERSRRGAVRISSPRRAGKSSVAPKLVVSNRTN